MKTFISGGEAIGFSAIKGGIRFYAGYPITPASGIYAYMIENLPKVGGFAVGASDEISAISYCIGASMRGLKSMTATSGPGYSLMVEGIGLAVMLEVPCVIVNVQRGAPSTGLPTLVGQGDVMQARWGSHGDYEIIALAPNSCQEMFDLTIKAFNLSEKYRVPVTILSDEAVGHLREKVVIPPEEKIEIIDRKKPNVPPEEYWPYIPDEDLVPPMAIAGEGYFVHMTGLTHDERGYPDITGEAHERLVRRLIDKIQKNRKDIIEYEEVMLDDAEIVVVSFGITARAALKAVREARKKGIKAGLFRLITIWPFPEERIAEISKKIEKFVVAEINQGQVRREVERARVNSVPVIGVHKLGGELITPDEILEGIWKKQN